MMFNPGRAPSVSLGPMYHSITVSLGPHPAIMGTKPPHQWTPLNPDRPQSLSPRVIWGQILSPRVIWGRILRRGLWGPIGLHQWVPGPLLRMQRKMQILEEKNVTKKDIYPTESAKWFHQSSKYKLFCLLDVCPAILYQYHVRRHLPLVVIIIETFHYLNKSSSNTPYFISKTSPKIPMSMCELS